MQTAAKRSAKVSVSIGSDALRRAKVLAKRGGVSLSRVVTEAIELFAEEAERRASARELVASFPAGARATNVEKEALRKQWATPHEAAPKKRPGAG